MNYASIKKTDIANGEGVRVSIWVSGCPIHCPGCFNKDLWDSNYGQPFTEKTLEELIIALDKDYITGLSILGGEPLSVRNRGTVAQIVWWVKYIFKGKKDIWLYTGYDYNTVKDLDAVKWADVIVDGPFIESEKDISLKFRGSGNQRIIRKGKEMIFYE